MKSTPALSCACHEHSPHQLLTCLHCGIQPDFATISCSIEVVWPLSFQAFPSHFCPCHLPFTAPAQRTLTLYMPVLGHFCCASPSPPFPANTSSLHLTAPEHTLSPIKQIKNTGSARPQNTVAISAVRPVTVPFQAIFIGLKVCNKLK